MTAIAAEQTSQASQLALTKYRSRSFTKKQNARFPGRFHYSRQQFFTTVAQISIYLSPDNICRVPQNMKSTHVKPKGFFKIDGTARGTSCHQNCKAPNAVPQYMQCGESCAFLNTERAYHRLSKSSAKSSSSTLRASQSGKARARCL